eukprot:jgi/Mesvir1/20610/Mv14838-RA.1
MGSFTSIIALPLLLLFIASGLIMNFMQLVIWLTLRPFSLRAYRLVNCYMVRCWWAQTVWFAEWWGGLKVRLFGTEETYKAMGNEHALMVCNHRSDVDWLVGWIVLERFGLLGATKAVVKSILVVLPVLGWSWWFSEYVSISRNWSHDESRLKRAFGRLASYPVPFVVVLFPEGTRFTQRKLVDAQEYARQQGMHVPENVLIPKSKGFVSSVQHLRSFMPTLFDVTWVFPEDRPQPTVNSLLNRKGGEMHVLVRRIELKNLPFEDEEVAQYLRDLFVEKDAILKTHKAQGTFGNYPEYRSGPSPFPNYVRSLIKRPSTGSGPAHVLATHIFKFIMPNW